MGGIYKEQLDFTRNFWEKLQEQETTEITHISGNASYEDRIKVYSLTSMSNFDQLPGGPEFVNQFFTYPSAVIRIGQIGLFATFLSRDDNQYLTTLEGKRSNFIAPITDEPQTLGQIEVTEAFDLSFTDETIDPRHVSIRSFGTQTVVQDLGTKHGTYIVRKKPSGGRQLFVPEWMPEDQLSSV